MLPVAVPTVLAARRCQRSPRQLLPPLAPPLLALALALQLLALLAPTCTGLAVRAGSALPPNTQGTHTVRIDDGSYIRGFSRVVSQRTVWHYLSVPFAKPPVGDLRFAAPQPPDGPVGGSFDQPLDVFHKPRSCYSWPTAPMDFERLNPALMMWWNNTRMSEDCLYLNVWTPTVSASEKKAVMVWIFGGGFYGGSASLEIYDGAVLASKGDVVVASMQYRTGALGFLYLDDAYSNGNMGLLDQKMALKWIWTNANKFGGDPTRITIFGESAGGVSVSYHLLSEDSRAYFSRAIMNSGTAKAWWASDDRATARKKANHLASTSRCNYTHHRDTMRCLRLLTTDAIQENVYGVLTLINPDRERLYRAYKGKNIINNFADSAFAFFDVPFKPVFGTPFIPEEPSIAISNGKMKKTDLLMGVVKDEGIFWIMYALYGKLIRANRFFLPIYWSNPMDPDVDHRLGGSMNLANMKEHDPADLVPAHFLTAKYMRSVLSEAVAFEYNVPSRRFGFSSWRAKEVMDAYDDITGDRTFKCPVIDFAQDYLEMLHHEASSENVWMYSFEHRSEFLPLPEWTGAMHGYELDYVFGMPFNKNFTEKFYRYTKQEESLSEDIMKFWTNFAKTGNPNQPDGTRNIQEQILRWPPYKKDNKSHIVLEVKTDYNYRVGQNLRRRQCYFWSNQLKSINELMSARSSETPCVREPKKSTQRDSGGAAQLQPSNLLVMLLGAAAAAASLCLTVPTAQGGV